MDKFLTAFVNDYNLKCENNKQVYGNVNGYQMCLNINNLEANSFKTFIFFKNNDEITAKLNEFITLNSKTLKLIAYNINASGLFFAVQTLTKKSGYENLRKALKAFTNCLHEISVPGYEYCPICGEVMETKELISLNGVKLNVCPTCKEALKEQVEHAEATYSMAPNNYFKGFLGAVIGGLLGALAWIFVGVVFGMILVIVAFLIAWLASQGYTKAKGKQNAMKVVCTAIVTIVYVVVSMVLVYVISFQKAGLDFFANLDNSEVMAPFASDMLISLLFGILGIIWSYTSMKRSLHKKQSI